MPAASYDIITAGGGLGGAALARAMAQRGARVLVLERETKFKDRVRGEAMMPWGVAEARALGIADVLLNCGHELPWWDMYFGNVRTSHRDLTKTTSDPSWGQGLPLIAKDRTRLPDTNFSGPDVEVDDTTRRRLFGEE